MPSALSIVQKRFPQVEKIVDSRKDVSVQVTGKDTTSAKVKNHEACAMAVACKRSMGLDGIIVSVKWAYLIRGKRAVRFDVPESVSREIVAFDRGADFVPGKYGLKAVPKNRRVGATPRPTRDQRNEKHRRRVVHHKTEGIRAVLGSKVDSKNL